MTRGASWNPLQFHFIHVALQTTSCEGGEKPSRTSCPSRCDVITPDIGEVYKVHRTTIGTSHRQVRLIERFWSCNFLTWRLMLMLKFIITISKCISCLKRCDIIILKLIPTVTLLLTFLVHGWKQITIALSGVSKRCNLFFNCYYYYYSNR